MRLNRLLAAAALVLVAVIVADAARQERRHAAAVSVPKPAEWVARLARDQTVPVVERVPLRASPETMFLATCRSPALRLAIERGPTLVLRYAGGPCHVPPVRLVAVARDPAGHVVFRGPAAPRSALNVNLAGRQDVRIPLHSVSTCRARRTLSLVVSGGGLSARATLRCSGGR